jgi:hypothetical protein
MNALAHTRKGEPNSKPNPGRFKTALICIGESLERAYYRSNLKHAHDGHGFVGSIRDPNPRKVRNLGRLLASRNIHVQCGTESRLSEFAVNETLRSAVFDSCANALANRNQSTIHAAVFTLYDIQNRRIDISSMKAALEAARSNARSDSQSLIDSMLKRM